jgi:outer membrane protein, heavy metal efflux system
MSFLRGKAVRVAQKPMVHRFSRGVVIVVAAATTMLAKSKAHAAGELGEVEATRHLCQSSPASVIAKAERLRGEALVTDANVWPNPSLVAEHQRTLDGPRDAETIVGLSVPLGIGGRRFLLQDAAVLRRAEIEAEAAATLFEGALVFREIYARAVAQKARARVMEEQQRALDALTTTVRDLERGGEAAGYDVLRQKAQAGRHRALLESARGRAEAFRTLLEAWVEGVSSLPSEQALANGPDTRAVGDGKTPTLLRYEASARASSKEASAARRRWVPELDVFAGYRALSVGTDTSHGISLGLTVPLTFFDHGQGEAARAEAEHSVALARAASTRREQSASVKAARLRIAALTLAVAETEKASADAAVIQTKATALYRAGEATLTELFDAIQLLEETRLSRLDLLEEMGEARIALMRAAGTMFDSSLDRVCRGAKGASK